MSPGGGERSPGGGGRGEGRRRRGGGSPGDRETPGTPQLYTTEISTELYRPLQKSIKTPCRELQRSCASSAPASCRWLLYRERWFSIVGSQIVSSQVGTLHWLNNTSWLRIKSHQHIAKFRYSKHFFSILFSSRVLKNKCKAKKYIKIMDKQ